jgi:hypothetical protein
VAGADGHVVADAVTPERVMSGGLVGNSRSFDDITRRMLADVATNESQQEAEYQQAKTADRSNSMSLAGTGAAMGYMIGAGASVGGPAGAAIGGGLGLLAGEFL